ncbi:hypothetical protein Pst134EA_011464 [Puccinia striiformis f. sp. tritici]|uniref:Uncharacterized protein n=1 Tax=Puccinia striiformis f. sp. tritici PST-78 TaxID=1165861 RepID=A0A0L0VL06_9BASI|nr:hypothetical protein Pst134EA_011464 [Puccinia striiformis f. sp. tritici]KAH9467843.1 hypothetical protein Pst134EA_011464 [Puccinia striiformis f. sp. tritici]KNE99901.1 hypothetical protein PSTG_06754 [Puccinia striiformis f. sp. tritici PST-78]
MSDRLQAISNSMRNASQGEEILTPEDSSFSSTLRSHTKTVSPNDVTTPIQSDHASQPPAVAPPKEQAKTTSNKRTKSTKTSTKATLEQPIGKPPATQRGLLSQEEAQLIERLGTGTEEPEETGGDQVRVDHTTKEQPGLSSLKFKKKVKATWTDEDIARVIEKYVAAEKVGDKETSDTFFALYKKMATICATNRDANLREITELEQVVIDPVLPPQKSPNSPHADTCPFPNLGNRRWLLFRW